MKNFILSFILPRRMEEHRDMNLFIVVLLFLLSMIICAGVPASRLEKVIKKNYLADCYVFPGTYEATFDKPALPTFTVVDGEIESYQLVNDQKVYEIPYTLEDGTKVNLTIVYQFDVDDEHGIDKQVFSMDDYLRTNPFNEDHTIKQKDVLVVFTKTGLYYIFNHGYNLNYISNPEGKLDNYSYLNVQTWRETDNWSIFEHDLKNNTDGTTTFTQYYYHPKDQAELDNDPTGKTWTDIRTNNYKKEGLSDYTPYQKINNNLFELFNYNGSSNVGMYSYKTLEVLGDDYLTFNDNPLTEFSDLLVMDLNSSVRTYSYILSFFYVMILPIVWVLIVWLIMRKNGELVRFREYYAIASISFLVPSIIIGIVGFFIPYQIIARFAMILHAAYFFICVSRINSMNNKGIVKEPNKKVIEVNSSPIESNENIETKPISEVDYHKEEQKSENNRPKISEIE